MYVTQSNACTAPNSLQPPSKAEIWRGIRMLASMEGKVRNARQAFNCLLYRDDLNTNGWPLATNGGVPASTIQGCPSPAASAVTTAPGGSDATPATTGVNFIGIQYWPDALVTLPDPTAIASNDPDAYPQPPAPSFPPLTAQAHSRAARALAKAAAVATNPGRKIVAAPQPQTPQQPMTITPAPVPIPKGGSPVYIPPIQNWNTPAQGAVAAAPAGPGGQAVTNAWQPIQYSVPSPSWTMQSPQVTQLGPGKIIGVGDFDSCSFLSGLLASVAVAAGGWYLWNEGKRRGLI